MVENAYIPEQDWLDSPDGLSRIQIPNKFLLPDGLYATYLHKFFPKCEYDPILAGCIYAYVTTDSSNLPKKFILADVLLDTISPSVDRSISHDEFQRLFEEFLNGL
jgi:hypothetical protein